MDDERILRREFDRWIDARRPAADGTRIPVFIFALQGGGIYAASAGASLLARLEDRCPGFSRNIFAVSGVSGGSVGAVLYNSIAEAHMAAGPARCAKLAPPGSAGTTDLVRRAIRKDHLAPVGMFIVPDLIGRLAFGGTAFGRAEALEGSLKRALAGLPGGSAAVKAADAEFVGHWNPATARVPAPILNTTWVETGFRVAFAPFQLKPTGDGTLYSFADRVFVGSPGNESAEVRSVTVMQAAVTSARFPGAMGAWQLRDHVVEIAAPGRGNGTEQITKTWNFVDGGYADGSGVSTALEIYQKLKSYIEEGKRADGRPLPDIDLRLIVLTESPPQLDLSKVANGTKFSDTVAPVAALLNVRSLLASRAVTSAADQLSSQDKIVPGDIGLATTGRLGDPKRKSSLLVVRLDLDDFPLTLGWTISDFSNSTIRLMLGEAELCRDLEPAAERSRDTILGNSCVQRELLSLFGIPFAPLVPRPVRASAKR